MELNFSKKTRKIVASLLAVAILLGVLPVSGLTGNSSGAEGNNSSANTIFVKSDYQPVLFDSNGNVKSVLTKKDGTYTGTNVNSSDQIVFLRNDVAKGITVGNTIVFYKKSSNTSTTDDAEPYDRIHVWKENGEPYKEWKSDDAIMKKYSGNLYYYIYPSDKNKVIFHNGLNDDEVGVKKSKEWDLNEWQVYTKNGLAGSLLNTLPTCKVGDNNAFSYYSGKITSEKIEKSDKFGATVTDVAGNESDVFKNDKITFYKFLTSKENSEALIDNVKVNDVDGFKGVVTAQKLKEDCTEVEYTYTYTDNTYGIKFTDTKTVNYTFETPLSVSGKWNVKVNDKEVTANDKLYYKDEASFNKITVSFDNAKVTYGGKEISVATNDSATEDGSLKSEYFLNDKKISSDSLNIQTDSNKSEAENILKVKYSYTVNGKTYETFETFTFYCYVDSTAPEITSFEFATVESDVDKVLSFLTFGIYNNDQVVVTVNAKDEKISSGIKEISLYNGEDGITADDNDYTYENGVFSQTFTLACGENEFNQYMLTAKAWDNVNNESASYTFEKTDKAEDLYSKGLKAKPSDSADTEVVTNTIAPIVTSITSKEYGSVKYTKANKTEWYSGNVEFNISAKDSTDDNYHTGIKSVTATFNGTDVSEKLKGLPVFTAEKVESVNDITFNTEGLNLNEGTNTVEVTVVNNSGMSSTEKYVVYVDKLKPVVSQFKFETVESDVDKILSFLTFGIYNNEKIQVTVSAYDVNNAENAKSGIDYLEENHAEIQLYNGGEKIAADDNSYSYDENGVLSRTFTLACGENEFKQYMLTAKAWDNVHNESESYTFEKPDKAEDLYSKELKAKPSDSADTEVVTNTIKPIVTSIISEENGNTKKYTDENSGKEWYSGDDINFFISAEDSEDYEHHTGIKSITAKLNGTGVDLQIYDYNKSKYIDLPDNYFSENDVEWINEVTFNTKGMKLNEGENTIEVKVINNSGMSASKPYKFYIDRTAPTIEKFTIITDEQSEDTGRVLTNREFEKQEYRYYFNKDTKITVSAKDIGSGVSSISLITKDISGNEEQENATASNFSTDGSVTFTVKAEFKGEIYAYAVDRVENEGEKKKPDDLIVETQQHHNGNASVTMSRAKASYKDNSGLDLYSGNVNARVVFEDAYAGIKDATITVYDYKNDVTGTIYAEIGNDGSIKKTEVTGSVNNIIFNDDYTTSKDNLLPKLVIDYVVTDNSNNIKITTSMTDRAGNKTDNVKDSLSIDKTKPVIDVKYDNNEHTTYGGNDYYKADRTATVTVTERNFDESLVEATIMRNGGRYTTIGGWTHNNNTADPDKSTHVAKIVYNTDGDFTFDIAVKDKAMNSADKFTQQKFTVDKTAPVIDVSFDNNSAKNGNYYKADRTATIKITEHNFNSGSQYVNIPVTAEGATAPSVVGWSGSGDDHNATVSFNKDGKYSFTVDYTDLAGNKAVQKKVDSFYIDKTAPEVEITGVADHQAYNGTVAPVVTYRDDNFTDDHDFRFTKIDINGKSDDTSKFDYDTGGNGVTEFIYKYRDFAEVLENDGIYNFTVELSDKAGNSTSKSVTFSVNRFGSTFKASDESKKLINNGYTNAEQDIVIEEINVTPLTKHSVTLAKSGGNSTELVENTDYTFTSSNNGNEWCKSVYTVNKKNFSDEAAYTVTIMSVDKAKNTNNNRMADSSLSTEQKNKRECAISFVVDKTSPLVSITGIKDNELYKEASKKVKIVCEDDNLDKSKLVVTLDNKKLAEGEDYTIVDDKDGSIAGMLTAEIVLKAETGGIKENLKVTIGDLAGNTGEKSVDNFILSANIFQRFFANPVLVICTFAGLALVIAAVIFFVAKKRKKAE